MNDLKFSEITLEKVRVAAMEQFSPEFAASLKIEDDSAAGLAEYSLLRMVGEFAGALHNETVSKRISVPKGVWSTFKQLYAPGWFNRRWPPTYEIHTLEVKRYRAVCPHLPIHMGCRQEAHLTWLQKEDVVRREKW